MGGQEISAALTAALPLIESLFALGLPGILMLLVSVPAIIIVLVCILEHRHARQMSTMLEAYREDTRRILQEGQEKHAQVVDYYEKNVTLVKSYERMVDNLQTLVVNNTRAMERLTAIIEHRSS